VPAGADAGQIGKLLESAGVVDNAKLFEANATVTLRRSKLRPGKYTLPKNMTNGGAIEALMQGPKAKVVKTFKFTLPEGRSRRENEALVKKGPFEGDYLKATTDKASCAARTGSGCRRRRRTSRASCSPRPTR
jgi:cell division protein YceG involved in septum cleavage